MVSSQSASMTIRMNRDIKQQAQEIFSDLGMDMTTAINIFLRQVINYRGLPFDVRLEVPNPTTLAAFEEGERMLRDPHTRRFTSVDELFAELDE